MVVLSEGDKYYSPIITEDNEEYYKIKDKVCDDLLSKKVKTLTAGFDYQYLTFKDNIKVKKHELHGQVYLLVSNGNVEFDMNPNQWGDIIIRKDGTIEIDTQGGGIYIEMEEK